MKTKLTTKDLITAGAFGAIYLVLLTVLSSVLTIVPILFLATPLIAGIIHGNHLSADFCSCMGINR